jgi:hypothetical protein
VSSFFLEEADVADSEEEDEDDEGRAPEEVVLREDEQEAVDRVMRRHEMNRERLSLSAEEMAAVRTTRRYIACYSS